MHEKRHKAFPNSEHKTSQQNFNWENIRVFLAVARTNSFRAATDELGISLNTIRRRIDALEHEMSAVIFARHANGVILTKEGEDLFEAAKLMETASFAVSRVTKPNSQELSGAINLTVTEGLGTFWLIPRIAEFQQTYPKITLDLQCQMQTADIARLESDLSVQLDRPQNQNLIMKKLGRLHIMPYASTKYLDTYGRPKSILDYRSHKFVVQVADQVHSSLFEKAFPKVLYKKFISVKTNNSSSHFWAICQDAGIGFLPTYASIISDDVEPIDVGAKLHRDIWLVYHPDMKGVRRVLLLIDWITRMFNPNDFSWFSDDFIHPNELKEMSIPPLDSHSFVSYPTRN